MAEEIQLNALKRSETGSVAARRLRRDGWLPGVVEWKDGTVVPLKMNRHDFEMMLKHHRSEHIMALLALEGEGAARKVLLREVQHHVLDGKPLHVDFGEISMTDKMHVAIPVVLKGEPEGVKTQGGILEQQLFEIEVSCLPGDLVESFEADVSALEIGDSLAAGDVPLGAAFRLLTEAEDVVALVSAPRKEVEPAEEEAAEGQEPEVIGKGAEPKEEE